VSSAWHNTIDTIYEGVSAPLSYLVLPQKRIHFFYLITSSILAFYVYKKSKRKGGFLRYLFPKKVWNSSSAWVDYKLIFSNSFIKILLIAPFVSYSLYIAYWVTTKLEGFYGLTTSALGKTETLIWFTITLVVISDLATYLVHLLMHKVPFLWEFHKTHHSATTLNPITQYRIHPVELIINNARHILVFGFVYGVFDYLSDHQIHVVTFLGANVLTLLFFTWGANLRHSHVKLTYFNWLERILISPFQHQIHHSDNPEHFNKNLGSKLAIWDWLFGTLVRSKETDHIKFGLGKENSDYKTWFQNLFIPFKKEAQLILKRIRKNNP
jgi:sterol desaturase/sphingolipid hydroxylase (fatty acid hydroxylase superfamily)